MEVQIDGSEAEEEMSDDAAAANKLRLEGPSLKAARKARAKGEIEEQHTYYGHTQNMRVLRQQLPEIPASRRLLRKLHITSPTFPIYHGAPIA